MLTTGKKIIIGFIVALSLGFGLAGTVVAQTDPNPGDTFGLGKINQTVKLSNDDPREIAARIINIALGLLGIVMVGLVLYGGFLYMTAGGNDEQIGTAKKYIINAIIGLAIILASFAIVQFVFKSLTDATLGDQTLVDDDSGVNLDICNPLSDKYDAAVCTNYCAAHPEYETCKNQAFFVMAITPGNIDSKNELTEMSNIRIRVLFSHALAENINLPKSVILTKEGTTDPLPVSVAILENNRVLEVTYAGFVVSQAYTVTVNPDLKDSAGKDLEKHSAGGIDYPTTAKFTVSANFEDKVKPAISGLVLNGTGGNNLAFNLTDNLTIAAVLDDRATAKFGGNGLVKLSIADDTGALVATDYTAPLVVKGSIDSFAFNYTTKLDNRFTAGKKYTVTVTGFDIDSNVNTASIGFMVKAAHCNNGVQDGDETGVDAGGSCGGGPGDKCVKTSDCASGFQCIANLCTAVPMIEKVDQMNGASGNWVSILGKHFGTVGGKVEFATDFNSNGQYDGNEWVPAEVISCDSTPSWNPDWVVVKVPGGASAPSDAAIKFNGPGNRVEIKGDQLELGKSFTLEAWIKPDFNSKPSATILAKGNAAQKIGYFLTLTGFQPTVYLPGLSQPGPHNSNASLSPNTWSHVVVTYNGSQITWYINGQQRNTIQGVFGSVAPSPGKNLWVGMREDMVDPNPYQFVGLIDEVAVYNKPFSLSETIAHYNGNKKDGGTYASVVQQSTPLGYWRLGETSGLAAIDASTYKTNGIYVGGITLSQPGIFASAGPQVGIGEKSAIRITLFNSADGKVIQLSDSTVDDFGPKPAGDGLFTKNDIKRPGLCRVGVTSDTEVELDGKKVTLLAGNPAATPKVPVTAHGSGFGSQSGTNKILFGAAKDPVTGVLTGGYQGEIKNNSDWTDLAVNTKVPENLKPGNFSVHISTGGESSNGVKFTILSPKAGAVLPIISTINPPTTTPKSFITIVGSGFGATTGQVFVADSEEHTQTCGGFGAHESCESLNVDTLPVQCGSTWTDTQVIAEIPAGLKAGTYHVSLKNNLGFRSEGANSIIVKSDPPLPGLCRIEPAKGPAPLPALSEGINLYGINLGANSVLYFWQPGAEIDKPETWLNSDKDTLNGTSVIKKPVSANQIKTLLPVGAKGTSMSTGPIKVKNADGSFTNSVNYKVESCVGAKDLAGYHCCFKGPETGSWKKNDQACSGEAREAGYVWRFSTGVIADLPKVVEECNDQTFPTPTPREQATSTPKIGACVNSTIALRFNMGMNSGSLNADTVKVFSCKTSTATSTLGKIDCGEKGENKTPVTLLDIKYEPAASTLIIREVPPSAALTSNTWYQVELSDKIKSQQSTTVIGIDQVVSTTLRVTKPCGPGTAYCFTFKTGTNECTLVDAAINPPKYTARQLGVLQDPRYPFDSSKLFLYDNLPASPFYYFVWGKGNQECSVINVDQYPWKWSPAVGEAQSDKAIVYKKTPPGTKYVNTHAVVQALAHTAPQSVDIKAEFESNAENFKPISDIDGTDILQLAKIDPGAKGYQVNDKVILPPEASDLLSFQSSFTVQFKFSQSDFFPYNTLLEKRNTTGPAIGYKVLSQNSQLCFYTYTAPVAQVGVKHCTTGLITNADGFYNVLLSWDKPSGKLSWINLNPPLKQEVFTVNAIPNSIGLASLVGEKQPATAAGPTFFKFVHKNKPSDFKIVQGGLHFAPTSPLTIDLTDPVVTYFEPNCVESCVNATIRADFNRAMDPTTFASGFKVYKCSDGTACSIASEVQNFKIDTDASNYLSLRTTLTANLDPNTYYKVALNSTGAAIKSIAQLKPAIVWGKALPKTEWVFKTRADGKPCGVSSLKVAPVELLAKQVGQQDKYLATPYSSPNACSKVGQALNKWDYSYVWSTKDTKVAKISNIKPALYANISYACTNFCVKKGSTVAQGAPAANDSICGDGIVGNGEDCDVAVSGEIPNISCSLNCLRPGTTTVYSTIGKKIGDNVCGNGKIENKIGEQCDPGYTDKGEIKTDDPNCTAVCLLRGSVAKDKATGKVGEAVCGNTFVDPIQEACDIDNEATKKLCSNVCLHQGTKLASYWCSSNVQFASNSACLSSVSVCGNGKLEPSEDCEPGSSGPGVCTNKCVYDNACGLPTPPCAKGVPGCTDKCTLLGSKTTYANPSVCGDGVKGTGEDVSCELTTAGADIKAGPTQIVEAVGTGDAVAGKNYQETKIQSSIVAGSKEIKGEANYQLQCGYTEYVAPTPAKEFNDCPNNSSNNWGVNGQTCCQARPKKDTVYPADGAGFSGTEGICLNTYISASFTKQMRPETINQNIFLVRGHTETNFNCSSLNPNAQDVTNYVKDVIQFSVNKPLGFWAKVWQNITGFFRKIIGDDARATAVKNLPDITNIKTWCANEIPVTITTVDKIVTIPEAHISTVASLAIGAPLNPSAVYGVILRGDVGGMVDVSGVPLGSVTGNSRNDAWFFKTGLEICKIESVSVDPKSQLFTKPNTTSTFSAIAVTKTNQEIIPTPGYSWAWSWGPNNPVFDIPLANTPANKANIIVGAKNVQGHITGVAQATITADTSGQNNQINKVFADTFDLTALFCENPWPAPADSLGYPYIDKEYNFQMSYCADAGKTNDTSDDLPHFNSPVIFSKNADDVAKKIVFFNSKNEDAVGLQIFSSSEPLKTWYAKKFGGTLGNMQIITLANYEALTDGNNYYIQALNYKPNLADPTQDSVEKNIYLFSINPIAGNDTKEAFKKLLGSLEFNINMSDQGYCLAPGGNVRSAPDVLADPSIVCTTDFDCRDASGTEKTGTIGVCSNAKTKFFRDWKRLPEIATAQDNIDTYFAAHQNDFDFKGNLAAGSFVPGYTVSHWGKSWSLLNSLVGELPVDPIDKWTDCSADDKQTCWDAKSTTYFCPKFSSVYEYEYVPATKSYVLHAPLEFFTVDDTITKESIKDFNTFSPDRWAGCTPGGSFNPFSEKCGDGILNAKEQCDPPGKIEITDKIISTGNQCKNWGGNKSCTTDADCGYYNAFNIFTVPPNLKFHLNKSGGPVCQIKTTDGETIIPAEFRPELAANEYVLYGCKTNTDCRDFKTYSDSKQISLISIDKINNKFGGSQKMPVLLDPANPNAKYWQEVFDKGKENIYCNFDYFDKVNVADTCEPVVNTVVCADTQTVTRTCTAQCSWQYGSCISSSNCGNGIVEGAEACDDGALNGTYGHCNKNYTNNIGVKINGCTGLSSMYCGNGIKDSVGAKSYEFCDASDPASGFTPNYNVVKAKSCSWDCQGTGGYCGDNFVQTDNGEQCDDGNDKDGDLCSAACKFTGLACKADAFGITSTNDGAGKDQTEVAVKKDNIIPESCAGLTMNQVCSAYGNLPCVKYQNKFDDGTVNDTNCPNSGTLWSLSATFAPNASVFCDGAYIPVPEKPDANPSCGNGKIDESLGEVCDAGAKNDVPCVVEPGKKICTYCVDQCKKIQTIDATTFCGNGKIDAELGEKCDIANGAVLGPKPESLCYTEYDTCLNNCPTTPIIEKNKCGTACTTQLNSCKAGGTVALTCPDKGSYQCINNCTSLSSFNASCVSCGVKAGGPTALAGIINPLLWSWSEMPADFATAYFFNESKLVSGEVYKQVIGTHPFTISASTAPVLYFSFKDAFNSNSSIGLETNQLCSANYGIMFNSDKVNPSGSATNIYANSNKAASSSPYSVGGESGTTVLHEYIMSPAVPPGVFRVVLKWTAAEKDAEFNGSVFNEQYSSKITSVDKFSDVISYMSRESELCTNMLKFSYGGIPYWKGGPSLFYTGKSLCSETGGVQVGSKINSLQTYVHSFTIDTNQYQDPFGFFVGALDKPIGLHKNSNLEVQVYTYREGQKPLYSIYGPAAVYKIKNAANTSTNLPAAIKYWHVFNLVKENGAYQIKPIDKLDAANNPLDANGKKIGEYSDGMLQSDFCNTLNHIPGSECKLN